MSGHHDERDDASLILLISSASDTTDLITDLLQTSGFRTISAENGPTGILIAEKYAPNAILLDVDITDENAHAVCKELKSRFATADTPVLFLTNPGPTDELISRCYDAGGHDLISRPVNKINLLGRLRVVLREQSLRESYRQLATQDPHTNMDNRRQLFMHLSDAITAAKRDKTESILVLGDIDKLTTINARYGYEFGDELILTFARLLKRFVSPDCKVGRITDDAMAAVLKNTTKARALSFCERISQTFSAISFDAGSDPKHFTASFGLADYDGTPGDMDADLLMKHADIALFEAKKVGRGRICAFWKLDPESLPHVDETKRHTRHSTREASNRAYVGVEKETDRSGSAQNATPSQEE